jgi:hypothetical protein
LAKEESVVRRAFNFVDFATFVVPVSFCDVLRGAFGFPRLETSPACRIVGA